MPEPFMLPRHESKNVENDEKFVKCEILVEFIAIQTKQKCGLFTSERKKGTFILDITWIIFTVDQPLWFLSTNCRPRKRMWFTSLIHILTILISKKIFEIVGTSHRTENSIFDSMWCILMQNPTSTWNSLTLTRAIKFVFSRSQKVNFVCWEFSSF